MKTIIIIVIFLFCISLLNSQDIEPAQRTFNFKGNAYYYMSGDTGLFKQTKPILGWQWGGTPLFPHSNTPALELEKNIKMKIIY